MNRARTSQGGFTLLELLVAMTIFAFIGLGAHAMLRAVLDSHETAERHANGLADLQKTVRLMEQDIRQLEPQSVVPDSGLYAIRFTRHGWPNPLGRPRSGRVGIAYGLRNAVLTRYYWPPDAADGSEPVAQPLLNDVSNLAFQASSPGLMTVMFSQTYFGDIRRVIEVAGP